MTGVISVNINANDGFQANRWTKNGERGLADRVYVEIVGKDDVHIGMKTVLMPHEGPIFGQGTNLAKDWLVANGEANDMSIAEFLDACMAGGEAWLTMHRQKYY